jgi:hypothetical protein
MPGRFGPIIVSTIVLLSLLIISCGPVKSAGSQSTARAAKGIAGTITTGQTVAAAIATVSAGGGSITITFKKPGDPLDGMSIAIPAGAYSSAREFRISYAPVVSNSFGADFNPITPLISVDNGGQFAGQMMVVTIPVTIPADSFAMGFIYDRATKTLEGMPLLAEDASSITVGTRHFSDFIISMIPKIKLKKDIDTHFRPGIDDWQFTNRGSFIAPGGHCAGQSISAMWYYYTQPDGKDLTLCGRYDNNGNQPATPGLWQDDSLGYRFASVIQADIDWDSVDNIWLPLVKSISHEDTWNAFAYTMQLTGEPQLVGLYSKTGGGHAMIVYRIKDGNMLIADPNYPGNTERIIHYGFGKFLPYSSGDNREAIDAGISKQYETIMYEAKSSLVDFPSIAARWAEFKDKTIGDDLFPGYSVVFRNEKGQSQVLTDGTIVSSNKISIDAFFNGTLSGVNVFRDGAELLWDTTSARELKPGNNLLGVLITKQVDNKAAYVDFQYINVSYGSLTLKPASQQAEPNRNVTFTVEMAQPAPAGSKLEWHVDGTLKNTGSALSLTVSFPNEGTHTISVKVVDSAGKVAMQAQGQAVIKGLTTTTPAVAGNNLSALQQMKTFSGVFQGKCNVKERTSPVNFVITMPERTASILNITWNGSSFSGKVTSGVEGDTQTSTVSGTVSGDGRTLTSLVFTYRRDIKYTLASGVNIGENTIDLQFRNIPIADLVFANGSSASSFDLTKSGPEVKSSLVKYEQHNITNLDGKLYSETTYLPDTINWNGTGPQDTPTFVLHFRK